MYACFHMFEPQPAISCGSASFLRSSKPAWIQSTSPPTAMLREREREREFRVHLGSPVELNLHLPLAMSGWNSGQGPIVQNILSCKFDKKVLEKSKFHHFLCFQTFIWNDNILDCKQTLVSHSYKSVVHNKWTFLCRASIRTHDLPDTMTD